MRLGRVELNILKVLFKSPVGLESFTLYRKFRISFPEFLSSINKLSSLNLILVDGQRIKILNEGALMISGSYMGAELRPKWREVPERFIGKKIDVNEFYIPSRHLLK